MKQQRTAREKENSEKRSVESLARPSERADHETALRKRLVKAQRQAVLRSPKTPLERIGAAKRKRRKEAEAQGRIMTPEGFTPKFKARLQAAERSAATDPESRALIAKARLAKRIEVAKREAGISVKPVPERFMGAANVLELERSPMAAPLPPRMGDVRAGAGEAPRKRRG